MNKHNRKGVGFFIILLAVGAILGGVVGEILGLMVPPDGIWHRILVSAVHPTLSPITLDLIVFHFTFGLGIKLNLLSVFGILGGIGLYYKL